ncbi:MAG: phospho-N-acetylmuramoyl-pentapeptide-transferase, partial [Paracoccaceae bacterium]
MLYHLLTPLSDGGDVFNLFRYITFRAGGAFLTALILAFAFGGPIIRRLRKLQKRGQPIRDDGPERHLLEKAGTPTMGGVMILGGLILSTLLWSRLDIGYVWIVLLVTLGFGAIGFADDFMKVTKFNTKGVSGRMRLGLGFVISGLAAVWAAYLQPDALAWQLALPVFKDTLLNFGLFYVPFCMIVIVGAANAVNLTDGLDGLA